MAVAVDDSTKPVDNDAINSPASEGAGEFRALKAKINSLYLNTGVDTTIAGLIDTNNRGLNVNRATSTGAIQYATKLAVARSGGVFDTYGIWAEASINDGVSAAVKVVSAASFVSRTGTNSNIGFLFGLTSIIYQQNHNWVGTTIGAQLVFANRSAPGVAAPSGLGSNLYNRGAIGLYLDAFARSSSGEFCGWNSGIVFAAGALDSDAVGKGYGISFARLTYNGGFDPTTAYNCKAVIKMRDMQSISWSGVEGTDPILQYFDPNSGRMTWANAGIKIFEVHMTTGVGYKLGVAVF